MKIFYSAILTWMLASTYSIGASGQAPSYLDILRHQIDTMPRHFDLKPTKPKESSNNSLRKLYYVIPPGPKIDLADFLARYLYKNRIIANLDVFRLILDNNPYLKTNDSVSVNYKIFIPYLPKPVSRIRKVVNRKYRLNRKPDFLQTQSYIQAANELIEAIAMINSMTNDGLNTEEQQIIQILKSNFTSLSEKIRSSLIQAKTLNRLLIPILVQQFSNFTDSLLTLQKNKKSITYSHVSLMKMSENIDYYFQVEYGTLLKKNKDLLNPLGVNIPLSDSWENERYIPNFLFDDNQLHKVNIYVQQLDHTGNAMKNYVKGKYIINYSPLFLKNDSFFLTTAIGKASTASDVFPPARFHFWLKNLTGEKTLAERNVDTRHLEDDPENSWGIFDFLRSKPFRYIIYLPK